MQLILDRATSEDQFRDLLLTDPDKALGEYSLIPVELEAIKQTELAEVGINFLSSTSDPEGVGV